MGPLVYIVILNWNGLKDTLECLESLKKIKYQNYEIVVVDNASENPEGEIIKEKYPEIYLIKNQENKGFAGGNNIGIKYVMEHGADYILLLNNDTVVSPDFLKILVDFAEKQKNIGIVGPKIFYYKSSKIWFNGAKLRPFAGLFRHLEFKTEDRKSKIKKPIEVDYVSGCCLLIKKEVIKKIGLLFEPFFAYYEEADWCYHARKSGYKSVIVPQGVIWHKVAASAGKVGKNTLSPLQAFYFARNARIFAKRNLEGFTKIIFFAAQYTTALAYNLLRCQNFKARLSYLSGLKENVQAD